MDNMIEVNFKFVPFKAEFEYEDQIYIKTNFQRGYYYKEGRKVFRNFKKQTKVKTDGEYFNG
jgi:hypothetical protein